MTRVIAGAGMFDTPAPPPLRERRRRRPPAPTQRLLPADVDGELALAMANARRRHPSARRIRLPTRPSDPQAVDDAVRPSPDVDRETGLRLAQ